MFAITVPTVMFNEWRRLPRNCWADEVPGDESSVLLRNSKLPHLYEILEEGNDYLVLKNLGGLPGFLFI